MSVYSQISTSTLYMQLFSCYFASIFISPLFTWRCLTFFCHKHKKINRTALTLQTRVLFHLSASDPGQLVVKILCFLGLMDGMNLDICIDGIKSGGKMINQGTWRQTVTFRWYITDTIIELCHSSSEAVKYLLQLLITDTMRTRCHVPTAAAIYLSHVGTHWTPSLSFADSPRGKCRRRSASSVHMCLLLDPCTAAGTDISCVCTCDNATRSSFGYAEDTMALFNSPTYNYSIKWWTSSVPASCIIVSLFCNVCL